jgi:predicted  nucleic acid-binding Zn-ribbon protein
MHPEPEETKPSGNGGRAVMWGLLLALVAGNIFAIWQTSQTQSRLEKINQSLEARIAGLNEQATAYGSRTDRTAAMLKGEMEEARQAADAAAARAKALAERKAEQLVNQLATQYQQERAAMSNEIGTVRDAATQANQEVNAVKTDVNGVRGDVSQTRTDLNATRDEMRGELHSVKGDLGVQSGLIATNAQQLAALRELGERTYFEFDITKSKEPARVGDVAVAIRDTQPNRGMFTLDVIADDRRVVKKNRSINEPVQFYTSAAKQPYEIVVNEVHKGRLVGYLAVPKVMRAAR